MKPSLVEADYVKAAESLRCEVAAIKAVCMIEAPFGGFNPDDTPVTLFEGHKFSRFTKGLFDISHPDLSFPAQTRKYYGKTWQLEQSRLQRAVSLNRDAALMSASFGKFQIMGFNYGTAGHSTLQSFINAMYESEASQLDAFVSFVKKSNLTAAIQKRDWVAFAKTYNGAGYATNSYDTKLANAYQVALA